MAKALLDAGCKVLMPWAAPIGSGRGLDNPAGLRTMRETFPDVPLIVDAGLGAPSHVAQVMEMGYEAVLVNTAIARAQEPVTMARAFAEGARAGRSAFEAGVITPQSKAEASTPVVGRPFWHQSSV